MSWAAAILALPLAGAAVQAALPWTARAALLNAAFSAATFVASVALLFVRPEPTAFLFVDDFNVYLVVLTSFVAFTAAWFSASYIAHELEIGRFTPGSLRFYHTMYQLLSLAMLLALLANNIGLMWVAVEGATLVTVVMVSLYGTREAIEAAWKYFLLGSVGIALALFGTILIYLAAQPVVGTGIEAMAWTVLAQRSAAFDASVLNLAFVFLLVGYGTKVGLAPLHAWLPDAHAEGPTPISAVLSGLLLNVALYAVLRFKMILAGNADAIAPGPLMLAMGLASVLLAAAMLYRRRDVKRFFAYSSIEHMGIVTFAFGVGGPIANLAGLLHMALHSLTKSAIFFAVGHVVQARGSQKFADIQGLTASHPALGWGLVAAVAAIAGLPPMGLFMSEFLVLTATIARRPWLAAPLAIGLVIGFGALLMRVHSLCFGTPRGESHPLRASLAPIYLHLALVLCAGLYLPPPLVAWFQSVARQLGG